MSPSEIKELKERFTKAVSFSIMLAVLTNIVSFFFVMGSEAWSESFTPGSIQPFYEFKEPSEKLHRSRASWLSSSEEELAPILPQETYPQQMNEEAFGTTDPLTCLINAFEYTVKDIMRYFETILKYFLRF